MGTTILYQGIYDNYPPGGLLLTVVRKPAKTSSNRVNMPCNQIPLFFPCALEKDVV